MTSYTPASKDNLLTCLDAAVPMRIDELLRMPPRVRSTHMRAWATNAVDEIAAHGDILLYGGGKRGEVAAVFNHLARALAVGALVPGGVTFAGRSWCVGLPAEVTDAEH